MQQGNGPARASFEVEKKFGGLEIIPNHSLVPNRSQIIRRKPETEKETTRGPSETNSNQAKRT